MLVLVLLAGCGEEGRTSSDYSSMSDMDGDGFTPSEGDCDDGNALVSPAEPEVCDSLDNDCDGVADEELAIPLLIYADADGDGYGAGSPDQHADCLLPEAHSLEKGDCDDADPTVYPEAPSTWQTALVDNDCDGDWEELVRTIHEAKWTLDGLEAVVHLPEWSTRPSLAALAQSGVYQLNSTGQAILLIENSQGLLHGPLASTASSQLIAQLEDPGTGELAIASFSRENLSLPALGAQEDLIHLRGMEAVQVLEAGEVFGTGRSTVGILAQDDSQRQFVLHSEGWVGSHDWDDGTSLLSSFGEPGLGDDFIPLGDINADGYDDLAVLFEDSYPLRVYLGGVQPVMDPHWQLQGETGCPAQLIQDATGDGMPELACIEDGAWVFTSYPEGGTADIFSADHRIPLAEVTALHGAGQDLLVLGGEWEDSLSIRFHSLLADGPAGTVGWRVESPGGISGFAKADLAADGSEDLFYYKLGTGEISLLELPELP